MEQNIQLKGIANTPSDHEASDGELGTCLNLVPEDGALKPVYKASDQIGQMYSDCRVRFVHKATHDDEIHKHYICYSDSNGWLYFEDYFATWYPIEIDSSIAINSVTAIGNILCFVGKNTIVYAIWNNIVYKTIDRNIAYKINTIITGYATDNIVTELGDEFWSIFRKTTRSDTQSESNWGIIGTTATGTTRAFAAVDAIANKNLTDNGDDGFKYIVLGVAAVKLFDGNYTSISNIFTLCPERIDNEIIYNADKQGDKSKYVGNKVYTYAAYVGIDINKDLFDLGIVDSVDIYLTQGETFLKLDIPYLAMDMEGSTSLGTRRGKIQLSYLSDDELYQKIESSVFYKSVSYRKDHIGKRISLKRPLGTEESLSLADLRRSRFGGTVAYSYNNRLHVGNLALSDIDLISYFDEHNHFVHTNIVSIRTSTDEVLGDLLDLPIDNGLYTKNSDICEAIIAVETKDNDKRYYHGKMQYPIPPILTIPINGAFRANMYIHHGSLYWKKEISLYQSDNWGCSIFCSNNEKGKPSYSQTHDVREEERTGNKYYKVKEVNNTWQSITEDEWNKQLGNCSNQTSVLKNYPSLIRVSEAENPLVFPAANSVQVGSSQVRALAANTHAISEGQFGTAPLYAFTDEGVWALITSGQGTYEARQPVNRDVVTNPNGIISTDDAVLYPTKRGIMLIQGSTAQCITDTLRGKPFQFTELFNKEFAKKVLKVSDIPEESVTYLDFDEFLENADMAFDYKDNRLILYNNKVSYAYVFSMKSQMWGAMECDYKYNINVYPDAYVVDKDNFIKDIHNDNPTEDTRYIVCTRPLTLGQPEQFKTMLTTIVRGYFRNRPGKCGIVLYGSNDLFNWFPIASSINQYLRGMAGSPYKYFRVAITGSLAVDESISNFTTDFINRWGNKLR